MRNKIFIAILILFLGIFGTYVFWYSVAKQDTRNNNGGGNDVHTGSEISQKANSVSGKIQQVSTCTKGDCEEMNIIETAYSTRNTEGCMRLGGIKIKNCQEYIYFLKAIDKKDEVLCKTIETPEDQKDCVKYVQNLNKNK